MAKFTPKMRLLNDKSSGVVIYMRNGKLYARSRTSLSGLRVKTDPAFKPTMEYAELMARASKIGSEVYQVVPQNKKQRSLYNKITGRAMKLLRDSGLSNKEILLKLLKEYR
jgi:hypothetical protein